MRQQFYVAYEDNSYFVLVLSPPSQRPSSWSYIQNFKLFDSKIINHNIYEQFDIDQVHWRIYIKMIKQIGCCGFGSISKSKSKSKSKFQQNVPNPQEAPNTSASFYKAKDSFNEQFSQQTNEYKFDNSVKEKQTKKQSNIDNWLDLTLIDCAQMKQVKKIYEKQLRQIQNERVHLIQKQTNIRSSNQNNKKTHKWNLLKTTNQMISISKQLKIDTKDDTDKDINKIIGIVSDNNPYNQNKIVDSFMQKIKFKTKYNIQILCQFQISMMNDASPASCLQNTFCSKCTADKNKYYLTIASQNIIISQSENIDGQIQQAIPYTKQLFLNYNTSQLSDHFQKFRCTIQSGRSQHHVVFNHLQDLLKFTYSFNQIKQKTGYFQQKIRFNSFSPQRFNNWSKFYHDGKSYFQNLHDEIEKAEKKICITGWCITPYLLLKRPQSLTNTNNSSRLDHTLRRAAQRGVKIFIIVYQEPSLFINNDSMNVYETFQKLNENFKVLRHPGLMFPQKFSHHQKSVIIDEKVAFMGGLDMCYGRWDNEEHSIIDKGQLWEGADYNNQRQRSITQPRKYTESNLNRQFEPRMPWHDIAIQVKGQIVVDLQRHFVQYWYFALADLSDDAGDHLRNFKNRFDQIKRVHHQKKQQKQQRKRNLSDGKITLQPQNNVNMAQELQIEEPSIFQRALTSLRQMFSNKLSRSSKQVLVQGSSAFQRPGFMRLQLCRSSSNWSTGIKNVQHSIYNAYRKLIQQSKEFIYIQNQFFMSFGNQISQDLAERIKLAYQSKLKYKVAMMMPLLPGFQGDVTKVQSAALRAQMQLQYQAISRHKNSIIQILVKKCPNIKIDNYISFFGVRNHALFPKNNPKTEIIYIHSKLMIVDDRKMIIGSANINDRSLLGMRDSELAMICEDPSGRMGQGSIFQFRSQIWKQHFAIDKKKCANIHNYWQELIQIGVKNAQIYRDIFGCIPDNKVTKIDQVNNHIKKQIDVKLYKQKITHLKGHYVQWPINFLKDEDLSIKFGVKEYFAGDQMFT